MEVSKSACKLRLLSSTGTFWFADAICRIKSLSIIHNRLHFSGRIFPLGFPANFLAAPFVISPRFTRVQIMAATGSFTRNLHN